MPGGESQDGDQENCRRNLDVKIKKDFLNFCSVQGTKNIGVEVKGRDNLALDT